MSVPADAFAASPGDALIGFRAFRLWPNGGVTGLTFPAPWFDGVNAADHPGCGAGQGRCPGDGCHCGFNAHHALEDVREAPEYVTGAVVGWGDVQVHRNGWRSQFAQVVALTFDPSVPAHRERVRQAAARLKVPLVERKDLEAVALEHGRPVRPDELPDEWSRAGQVRPVAAAEPVDRPAIFIGAFVLGLFAAIIGCCALVAAEANGLAFIGAFVALLVIVAFAGSDSSAGGLVIAGVIAVLLLTGTYTLRGAQLDSSAREQTGKVAELAAGIQRDTIRSGKSAYSSAAGMLAAHPELEDAASGAGARVSVDVVRPAGEARIDVHGRRGAHAARVVALDGD